MKISISVFRSRSFNGITELNQNGITPMKAPHFSLDLFRVEFNGHLSVNFSLHRHIFVSNSEEKQETSSPIAKKGTFQLLSLRTSKTRSYDKSSPLLKYMLAHLTPFLFPISSHLPKPPPGKHGRRQTVLQWKEDLKGIIKFETTRNRIWLKNNDSLLLVLLLNRRAEKMSVPTSTPSVRSYGNGLSGQQHILLIKLIETSSSFCQDLYRKLKLFLIRICEFGWREYHMIWLGCLCTEKVPIQGWGE